MTGPILPRLVDPYGAPPGADPRGALQSITLDLDRTEGDAVNRMKATHLEPFPDPQQPVEGPAPEPVPEG